MRCDITDFSGFDRCAKVINYSSGHEKVLDYKPEWIDPPLSGLEEKMARTREHLLSKAILKIL